MNNDPFFNPETSRKFKKKMSEYFHLNESDENRYLLSENPDNFKRLNYGESYMRFSGVFKNKESWINAIYLRATFSVVKRKSSNVFFDTDFFKIPVNTTTDFYELTDVAIQEINFSNEECSFELLSKNDNLIYLMIVKLIIENFPFTGIYQRFQDKLNHLQREVKPEMQSLVYHFRGKKGIGNLNLL